MDIVTHGMIGAVAASPMWADRPVVAASLALGMVMPDLDTFARLAGKRAFLRSHQTASHSVFAALLVGAGWAAFMAAVDLPALGPGLAMAAGMIGHALLDWTNTYGVALWWPLSRRRRYREWIFFIDAFTIAITSAALAAISISGYETGRVGWLIPSLWAGLFVAYLLAKAGLRARAGRLQRAEALVPSAWAPWSFLGCERRGERVRLFVLDALRGEVREETFVSIHDADYRSLLADLPEFVAMSELTPSYHVTAVEEIDGNLRLTCRDLRTRNFRTRFGELRVVLEPDGTQRDVHLEI